MDNQFLFTSKGQKENSNEKLPKEVQEVLKNYVDVFLKDLPNVIPPKWQAEMKIELIIDTKPKIGSICKLSKTESEVMKKQIENLLSAGLFRPIISPWGSPALITYKKDGVMLICIHYRCWTNKRLKTNSDFLLLIECGTKQEE